MSSTVPGTVMRIRDVYPGSEFSIPDPGSKRFPDPGPGSAAKNLSIFTPKKLVLSSRKNDLGCSSRIRIQLFPHPGSQDPGSKGKRALDPGSATMVPVCIFGL
jgi:hypothetical protein